MTDRPDDPFPDPAGPADPAVLAAEYALGLLEGAERAAFEARLRDDPALVRAVAGWQAQFAAMAAADVAPVAPPDRLESAIAARLFPDAARVRLWDRVAFWRGVSAVAGAVAVAAVGVAVLPVLAPPGAIAPPEVPATADAVAPIPPGTILMTHLLPLDDSGLGLAVTREPGGVLRVLRVAGGPTAGRAQQVWLVLDEITPPISLGLLGDDPLTILTPPPEVSEQFGVGAAMAISDEPPGGSPTGAPTGAILALGALVAL